jgi:2-hydroxy-3-oxopropionate reductase
MIAEDFSPGARASTQLKDLRNAMSASLNAGIDLPVLRLVESLFASMCANGLSERDHSALYLWLQRQIT